MASMMPCVLLLSLLFPLTMFRSQSFSAKKSQSTSNVVITESLDGTLNNKLAWSITEKIKFPVSLTASTTPPPAAFIPFKCHFTKCT